MLSKTKIKSRLRRKTNPEIALTIKLAAKNEKWFPLAKILSGPSSNYSSINLSKIDRDSKTGDTIIIPGKVLSQGNLSKKLKICSLSISKTAHEKMKETKSEFSPLYQEIKKNPKAEGLKILR